MSKPTFRIPGELPLDLVSHGLGGSHGPVGRLTPAQVEQIRRTVRRTPEAVVKVLPRNGNSLKAAERHLDYIGRYGELELETDDGDHLQGRVGEALLQEWDLDIDDVRPQAELAATKGAKPPKLIHKLMFSMPSGTPPDKVLAAARNFAREEFALQHRYALVLHTDEPHPHVHLVLKAISEQGVRLNIQKATLRQWRAEFARHLRLLGVPANATERAVRGESRKAKKDGIYGARVRGASTYMRAQVEAVASALLKGDTGTEPGKHAIVETRRRVEQSWHSVACQLATEGHHELADVVRRFVDTMPPPRTERNWWPTSCASNLAIPAFVTSTRPDECRDLCTKLYIYTIWCILALMKQVIWMGSSREDLKAFPREARREIGYQVEHVQQGVDPDDWKPMSTVGLGVREIRVRESSGMFRCIYLATRPEGIYVLHCFQKKTRKTSQRDLDLAEKRFKSIQVNS